MGKDRIRYFLFLSGRWRWRPTAAMRRKGFELVTFGAVATAEDTARAIKLNEEWDRIRLGKAAEPDKVYPVASVGEAYQRVLKLRAAERAAKGIVWTKEQESRDDWPRAWKWLDPVFGDVDPTTIEPEHFLAQDEAGNVTGLLAKVDGRGLKTERHRVVKVWRALWKKMGAMGYCDPYADPSLTFANRAPDPRQVVWEHREVLRRVQWAWREGFTGLAAAIAVAWDSMLSPIDVRKLTLGQMAREEKGAIFFLDRAKTGRAAAGTLTKWSEAVLRAYIASLPFELHEDAPIFRNRSGAPYSKDTMGDDFRTIRGEGETRQVADMRRSGAVEADAGEVTDPDLSNKMANTIQASARLRKTYAPVNVVSVRRVDQARARGRGALEEQKPAKSVIPPAGKVS